MSQQKIIAVVGATGAQGGGLVKAILADPTGDYAVRALTRDTTSPRAQELGKLGAEVVQADNYDEESLVKAFTGAYGAFLVTNFWALAREVWSPHGVFSNHVIDAWRVDQ
jgi:uncharacterized protein YbjT (DUF2867 family)